MKKLEKKPELNEEIRINLSSSLFILKLSY